MAWDVFSKSINHDPMMKEGQIPILGYLPWSKQLWIYENHVSELQIERWIWKQSLQ